MVPTDTWGKKVIIRFDQNRATVAHGAGAAGAHVPLAAVCWATVLEANPMVL